jgi:hypothetical protein
LKGTDDEQPAGNVRAFMLGKMIRPSLYKFIWLVELQDRKIRDIIIVFKILLPFFSNNMNVFEYSCICTGGVATTIPYIAIILNIYSSRVLPYFIPSNESASVSKKQSTRVEVCVRNRRGLYSSSTSLVCVLGLGDNTQ